MNHTDTKRIRMLKILILIALALSACTDFVVVGRPVDQEPEIRQKRGDEVGDPALTGVWCSYADLYTCFEFTDDMWVRKGTCYKQLTTIDWDTDYVPYAKPYDFTLMAEVLFDFEPIQFIVTNGGLLTMRVGDVNYSFWRKQ